MELRLTNPAHERFIADQIRSGQYASAEEVVEDILDVVINDALTDEDIAAIKEADEQFDRGEFVDFKDFTAEFRRQHGLNGK